MESKTQIAKLENTSSTNSGLGLPIFFFVFSHLLIELELTNILYIAEQVSKKNILTVHAFPLLSSPLKVLCPAYQKGPNSLIKGF